MLRPGIAIALALATALPAQFASSNSVYPSLVNTCGDGTPILDVSVHFPSHPNGAPVLRNGGWPVVVFLHGFNLFGYDYHDLGRALATRGFVVVMPNTARANYIDLDKDARALPEVLEGWNAMPGHCLSGQLDIDRMGLMGHSMGGGVTAMAIARSDHYRCGFALSPVFPGNGVAGAVEVPFGIVVGAGDQATPWDLHANPYYHLLGTDDGLRFLYVMDGAADHLNVAGLWLTGPSPIFERSLELAAGFFHHFLEGSPVALEACFGDAVSADRHLLKLDRHVIVPQTWMHGAAHLSSTVRVSVMAEDGLGGVLAAASAVSGLPTIFGTLYLDPATVFPVGVRAASGAGRIDIPMTVPNLPALVGLELPVQGLGAAASDPVRLGSPVMIPILP